MEITLSFQTIIAVGSMLTALGVVWKALSKISKFLSRQEKQDNEIAAFCVVNMAGMGRYVPICFCTS